MNNNAQDKVAEGLNYYQECAEEEMKKNGLYEGFRKEWIESQLLSQFPWHQILDVWSRHDNAYLGSYLNASALRRLELDLKKASYDNPKCLFEIKRGLLLTGTVLGAAKCHILISHASSNILYKSLPILCGLGAACKILMSESPKSEWKPYTLTEIVQTDMKYCPDWYNNKHGEKSNEEQHAR